MSGQLDHQQILQQVYDPTSNSLQVGGSSLIAPIATYIGQKTVVTAGTPVQVTATPTTITSVVIKALAANTGKIYVWNANTSGSGGFELSAGDTVTISINDLSKLYIDASVNSQSVSYLAS